MLDLVRAFLGPPTTADVNLLHLSNDSLLVSIIISGDSPPNLLFFSGISICGLRCPIKCKDTPILSDVIVLPGVPRTTSLSSIYIMYHSRPWNEAGMSPVALLQFFHLIPPFSSLRRWTQTSPYGRCRAPRETHGEYTHR